MLKEKQEKFMNDMIAGVNAGHPAYAGIIWDDKMKRFQLFMQHRIYVVTRIKAKITDERGKLYAFNEHSGNFTCIFRKGPPEKPKKNALLLMDKDGQYLLSSKDSFVDTTVYIQAISPIVQDEEMPDYIALWARFQKQPDVDIDIKNHMVAIISDYNSVCLLDTFADNIQNEKEGADNVSV